MKDAMLVLLVLVVLFGFYYVYQQQKSSSRDMRRMMKDLESLHKAELTLEDLQRELEVAKKEQESVATEKLNLERRLLEQSGDGDGMRFSYSDLEVRNHIFLTEFEGLLYRDCSSFHYQCEN